MLSVDEITNQILRREGGFVNDPDDPGGATNYGVTIHTMRRLGVDLDGDGDTDVEDVRRLTHAQAAEIFKRHYFSEPGINHLPAPIQASVYDMQVNAGAHAVRILQRLLVKMGFEVDVDGRIGPQTARASAKALRAAPDHLVDAYGIERRNYYYALADRRPASRKFARRRDGGKGGWIRRAEEFISPEFHFTETEHRERTAAWG